MNLKDKILILPYVVILMFDIAVVVTFGNSLLEGVYDNNIKSYYLLLTSLVALVICGLRILIIGRTTMIDKYLIRKKIDWLFILFISFVVAIIATTGTIKYFSINPFFDSFNNDPNYSPLKWFDLLNNNYHRLSFYALIYFSMYAVVFLALFKGRDFLEKHHLSIDQESFKMLLFGALLTVLMLFSFLFIADPMIFFWDKFINTKIIKQILSFIFSGSLIYFNIYFLLKKSFNYTK